MDRQIIFPTATTPKAVCQMFRSGARYIRGHAGYGGGKTFAGVHWMIKQAALNQGLRGLAVEPTHGMVTDVLVQTIEEVCQRHSLPYKMARPNGRWNWYLPDFNFTWMLRSGDVPAHLVGPTVASAYIDEGGLQNGDVFTRVVSRLRDARASALQLLVTGTPDKLNWFYSVWEANSTNPEYASFHWRTRDNLSNLAGGYEDTLRQSFDEMQFRAYADGEFVQLTAGVVFSNFSDENIVAGRPASPGSRITWAMDFNVDPMTASAWIMNGEEVTAIDEIVLRHSHTEETAAEIKKRFPFDRYPNQKIICDATGSARSTTAGYSNVDILRQAGFEVDYRHVHHELDAINSARRMIRDANGRRRLFISRDCPRLITSVKSWAFKDNSNRTQEEEYRGDKDMFFVPHLADNVKYLCHTLFPIHKPQWSIK